jgi:alpha-L-fucosidase
MHAMGTTQFMHFSMSTFTGTEQNLPPGKASLFKPTGTVNTDQWVKVAKSWGAGQICLTARHSGGFALWQTNITDYGLRQSPYMGGQADIVRDFIASCRKEGISPCLYLGFADSEQNTKYPHDPEGYLANQVAMLRELMTSYGQIDRIWFDFWGDACNQYGAKCPPGAFPQGWKNISSLMDQISPNTTLSMPGTDGCLLATGNNPEIGGG